MRRIPGLRDIRSTLQRGNIEISVVYDREKISALEIEDALRAHPEVEDCAVVGIPDHDWGERVCAAVVCGRDAVATEEGLRTWVRARLAPYKVPKDVVFVPELPRNAMGKVMKPAVSDLFGPGGGA